MYVIRVRLEVRPDAKASFEAHARAEAEDVPRRFAGCLGYAFHARVGSATSFLLYEEWEDRAAFEAYRGSAYFTEVGSRLRPLLSAPPDGAYYVAERAATAVA